MVVNTHLDMEFVVRVTISATLQVVDSYNDILHHHAVVRQNTIVTILNRDVHPPTPSYEALAAATQEAIARAAADVARMLLTSQHKQLLNAQRIDRMMQEQAAAAALIVAARPSPSYRRPIRQGLPRFCMTPSARRQCQRSPAAS